MNRVNRSFVAAAVAGGLALGSINLVHAGLLDRPASSASQLDDHKWKHPRMHDALVDLKAARTELDLAEDVFKGHKKESLEHVDEAIKQIHAGLKDQGDDEATGIPAQAGQGSDKLDDFPHMRKAMEQLRDAHKALEDASDIFAGHREKAMQETQNAINQLKEALGDK